MFRSRDGNWHIGVRTTVDLSYDRRPGQHDGPCPVGESGAVVTLGASTLVHVPHPAWLPGGAIGPSRPALRGGPP